MIDYFRYILWQMWCDCWKLYTLYLIILRAHTIQIDTMAKKKRINDETSFKNPESSWENLLLDRKAEKTWNLENIIETCENIFELYNQQTSLEFSYLLTVLGFVSLRLNLFLIFAILVFPYFLFNRLTRNKFWNVQHFLIHN